MDLCLKGSDVFHVDEFNAQQETPRYARMVANAEIGENDFNLNIPRYIDSSEPEDLQDIEAHLKGGIPNRDIDGMTLYWEVFPSLKTELFTPSDRENYSDLKSSTAKIQETVRQNAEFVAFKEQITALFQAWAERHTPMLNGLMISDSPKELIETLSEDILQTFTETRLIDKYDIYQYLMDYWTSIMQDDVFMIVTGGWGANSNLIPAEFIIARYFKTEHNVIDQLENEKDTITTQKEEMEEEHSGKEGVLEELKSDKGKLSKGRIQKRVKEIGDDLEFTDELDILKTYLNLLEQEITAGKKIKNAQKILDAKVTAKYPLLLEAEVKTLVVEDKWIAALWEDIEGEVENIAQNLTCRVKELAERYNDPLPKLKEAVENLDVKVDAHLMRMGFEWE